jgi:hypothetical protein
VYEGESHDLTNIATAMRKVLTQLECVEIHHGFAAALKCPLDRKMWLDAMNAKFKGIGKPF